MRASNTHVFELVETFDSLSIRLSATLDNIDRAAERTGEFLSSANLEDQAFNIILVMREALTNAVIHGCRNNDRATIMYGLRVGVDDLTMEVEDEGVGFDWRSFWRAKPNPLRETGRGLAIMRRYFTGIRYNEKGNKLTLKKRFRRPTPNVLG